MMPVTCRQCSFVARCRCQQPGHTRATAFYRPPHTRTHCVTLPPAANHCQARLESVNSRPLRMATSNRPPMVCTSSLRNGESVRLTGLEGPSALFNGTKGRIAGRRRRDGKWPVALAASGKPVHVKTSNLILLIRPSFCSSCEDACHGTSLTCPGCDEHNYCSPTCQQHHQQHSRHKVHAHVCPTPRRFPEVCLGKRNHRGASCRPAAPLPPFSVGHSVCLPACLSLSHSLAVCVCVCVWRCPFLFLCFPLLPIFPPSSAPLPLTLLLPWAVCVSAPSRKNAQARPNSRRA